MKQATKRHGSRADARHEIESDRDGLVILAGVVFRGGASTRSQPLVRGVFTPTLGLCYCYGVREGRRRDTMAI